MSSNFNKELSEIFQKLNKIYSCLNKELIDAAKSDDTKKIEDLVLMGADIEYKNYSCFSRAIMGNCVNAVEKLIQFGCPLNSNLFLDYTPLMLAVYSANLDVAKILLKYGADPNFATNGTPLIVAVRNDRPKFIPLLLENGANIDVVFNGKKCIDHIKTCPGFGVPKILKKMGLL